ncbi:hypothetical protein O9X98_06705 [Agrobacterium salinitolerans]|nr:hypothetical protein [Agrobacterium salinitolerans]
MKEIRHRDRDFTIQGVASAYEHGYEVAFRNKDDRRCCVQFLVLLNSAMDLVAVVNRVSEGVTIEEVMAAKEIAAAELASNPSVFHIVANASYEMKRLHDAADNARRLRKLAHDDPHLLATEARIADLDRIVKGAREWSKEPSRHTFSQFMGEHAIEANRREFDVVDKLEVGDEFGFHPVLSPVELHHGVTHMMPKPASITVIPDLSHLTPVRPSVLFRHGFDWPRVGSEAENGVSITCARPYDLFPKIADHVIEMMQHDGIVVGWTSQTETAAFEIILDRLAEQYRDPRVVIGSPEGTFSGRLSAVRLALGNGPTMSRSASGPTL